MNRSTVVSLILLFSFASVAHAQQRMINVSGDSVVWAQPDEVIVTLGIETFDSTLDAAKTKNDTSTRTLMAALKELKIDSKEIQTADIEIELHYRNEEHPSQGIEGYFARRMFSVTLKDVTMFESLVNASLSNGANRLLGFEYRTTELRKYRDQARVMAARAAREKAVLLCKELDCNVGPVNSISEGYFSYVGGWGARWNWNRNVNSFAQAQNAAQAPGEGDTQETMPIGQIGIHAQVSVAFEIK